MTVYYVWLGLALGAGNIRLLPALSKFGSAENIFNSSGDERAKSGIFTAAELRRMNTAKLSAAERIMNECAENGIEIITLADERYPKNLKATENPPAVLYVKGSLPDFDNTPTICIVGPRKVSDYGKKAAYSLSCRLARAGFTIVSGGAVGCDYYAHSGALKGGGKTVLVMGCGILSGYLPENEPLRKHVVNNGCIISEYPPQASATRYSFPVRNRIMAALSLGTVLIEAGKKSGALITANHALEQGREVFVIPGSPTAEEYVGSNALFRDGAKPLIDASDIFNEYIGRFPDKIDIKKAYEKQKPKIGLKALKPQVKSSENDGKKKEKLPVHKKLSIITLSKQAKIVYNHLDKQKFYPEDIKDTGLTSEEILSALTELEFEFLIRALPGGRFEISD